MLTYNIISTEKFQLLEGEPTECKQRFAWLEKLLKKGRSKEAQN